MTIKRHGDEIVWHNGGTGGFRSFAGFSKKSGLGVVVLSNTAISVDDIGVHLLNPQNILKQ
jgi:serine-type D-Ala-D-Ala carboxypeptidase/endopeptidase